MVKRENFPSWDLNPVMQIFVIHSSGLTCVDTKANTSIQSKEEYFCGTALPSGEFVNNVWKWILFSVQSTLKTDLWKLSEGCVKCGWYCSSNTSRSLKVSNFPEIATHLTVSYSRECSWTAQRGRGPLIRATKVGGIRIDRVRNTSVYQCMTLFPLFTSCYVFRLEQAWSQIYVQL